MKVIILAGGLPSTISEEDEKIPKPMAEIGDKPILWHIMKTISHYGFKDFVICTGYKGQMIKEFFMDYYIYQSDITVDLLNNHIDILRKKTEDWRVTVVDTGRHTPAAERIWEAREYIQGEAFLVVYGDCVSDINFRDLVGSHREAGKWATIAVARPTGRNEILSINGRGELLLSNQEYLSNGAWVNACVMVFEPQVLPFMEESGSFMEKSLFQELSKLQQIVTYKHTGFWSPMETRRDKALLDRMWKENHAPWKVWEDPYVS